MDAMNRFVTQKNINRYRKLASESTDAAERSRIMKLLAEEYAKFKLERGARAASPKETRLSVRQPAIGPSLTEGRNEMAASQKAAKPNRLLGLLSPRDY